MALQSVWWYADQSKWCSHWYISLNFGTPVFLVKKTTDTDEEGYIVVNTSTLAVDPVIKSPGYDFKHEDPSIYDDHLDPDHFCARREWPGVSLPKRFTTTANKGLIKDLQANHDNTTLLLKSLGVDACCEFKQNQVKSVTARIGPHTNVCKFCSKKVKNHQQLKSHIRSRDCKESKYKCTICNLSFGEAYTLKRHNLIHVEGGANKFVCHHCGKRFTHQSRLNEHVRAHTAPKPACQWCTKSFANPKILKDHQRGCKQRPSNLPPVQAESYECATCGRTYKQKKDLNKHQKKKRHN